VFVVWLQRAGGHFVSKTLGLCKSLRRLSEEGRIGISIALALRKLYSEGSLRGEVRFSSQVFDPLVSI
jgi:hypothetical protein